DLVGVGLDEVALGKEPEVGDDFFGADAGDLAGNEFLLGHLLFLFVSGVDSVAQIEVLERSEVKAGVKGVFVTIPQARRGAARVAKRVDVEIAQALGVADEFGKSSGSVGII